MWSEFWDPALARKFCLLHRDEFEERYPDWKTVDHIEDFISENLEEYCDWCQSNPVGEEQ